MIDGSPVYQPHVEAKTSVRLLVTSVLWPISVKGKESRLRYSLSNHIGIMTCLNLETAVMSPEIDRISDTCHAPLINLLRFSY